MDHGLKTKHRLRYRKCWKLFMKECSIFNKIKTGGQGPFFYVLNQTVFALLVAA